MWRKAYVLGLGIVCVPPLLAYSVLVAGLELMHEALIKRIP